MLLRDELRARGRAARIEPAWVRPQRPALYAALCVLGVAGSLLSAAVPEAALAILLVAGALLAGDLSGRLPVARLLLPRRATQSVVSEPPSVSPQARVRLIVTASLDAGRTGAAHRLAALESRARRALRGHLPSPLALLTAAIAVLAAIAAARLAGAGAGWAGPVALVPTAALVVGAFALGDIALAAPSAGANAHASAVATALALVAELDRDPPRHLAVELVLAGAGEGGQLGMREYVRARRRGARPEEIAVLALGPCGAGRPRVHRVEGLLAPARLHPGLVAVATLSGAEPTWRGESGALPARLAGWPAVGISCLDDRDRPGAARTTADTPAAVDGDALHAVLDVCLRTVRRLDVQVRP